MQALVTYLYRMNVFVAGGSGVLGRATVRALVEAGHIVRATARGQDKANVVRSIGAAPIEVDLYDPNATRRAIAGSDAVLRLTTKIPPLMKMGKREAWTETNRLRTFGARVLVDAAIAERIPIYIHESITFVYADGGTQSLGEDAPTDDGGTGNLRAALDGEGEAARFSRAGGRGIVLRFGLFYAPDAPSTIEMMKLARRGCSLKLARTETTCRPFSLPMQVGPWRPSAPPRASTTSAMTTL